MPAANRGAEPYSAWFADADEQVLYFGLSPFWDLWWQSQGDARRDLAEPGDHLIGRFDLASEHFLVPLRVRGLAPTVRSSVWDVLVHSNGFIYFTTYFEEIGQVAADGRDVRFFPNLGVGFNELWEGPEGNLWVSRYSDRPDDVSAQRFGSIVELTPDGKLVREIRLEKRSGAFTAPKSLAVDPRTHEIWMNADLFLENGLRRFVAIHFSPEGTVSSRRMAPPAPELHFVSFDRRGTGYFVESSREDLWLRVEPPGEAETRIPLGPRNPLDFVQDIKISKDGMVTLAYWSGHVTLVRRRGAGFEKAVLDLSLPDRCILPRRRSLLYSAIVHANYVYATLYCGGTILRAPIPQGPGDWKVFRAPG